MAHPSDAIVSGFESFATSLRAGQGAAQSSSGTVGELIGMIERHCRQIIEQFMRYTDPDEERRDVLSKVQLFCRSIKVEFLSGIKMGLHFFVKKSSLYINFGPC